jgi:hypothetical protein
VEDRVKQMLEIAHRILAEGRAPTPEEREMFRQLESEVGEQPPEWRERFADIVDRLAAALEGIGI